MTKSGIAALIFDWYCGCFESWPNYPSAPGVGCQGLIDLSEPLILAWQLLEHPDSQLQIASEDFEDIWLVPLEQWAHEGGLLGFWPSTPPDEGLMDKSSKLK